MNFEKLFSSFKNAAKGIKFVFTNEQNFRLQVYAAGLVIFLMFFFQLRKSEILVIILLVTLILILELLNSALEKFLDILKPRLSFQVEVVKDIMAAMVLIASSCSVIIFLIIFWPYLLELF